jgi:uncharacterized protein (TIGR04222 family)
MLLIVVVSGLVAVVVLVVVECLSRWRSGRGRVGEITDAYELAVLAGGGRSLADTVITALVRRDVVRESPEGLCSPVAGRSAEHPAERLVLGILSKRMGHARRAEIEREPGWRPLKRRIRADLVRRGLLLPTWTVWVAGVALLGGFAVLWANLGFVAVMVVVLADLLSGDWEAALGMIGRQWPVLLAPPLTVAFALVLRWVASVRTPAGEAAYEDVLSAHPGYDDSLEAYVLHGERPRDHE